jgi:hypothetical protein
MNKHMLAVKEQVLYTTKATKLLEVIAAKNAAGMRLYNQVSDAMAKIDERTEEGRTHEDILTMLAFEINNALVEYIDVGGDD